MRVTVFDDAFVCFEESFPVFLRNVGEDVQVFGTLKLQRPPSATFILTAEDTA